MMTTLAWVVLPIGRFPAGQAVWRGRSAVIGAGSCCRAEFKGFGGAMQDMQPTCGTQPGSAAR